MWPAGQSCDDQVIWAVMRSCNMRPRLPQVMDGSIIESWIFSHWIFHQVSKSCTSHGNISLFIDFSTDKWSLYEFRTTKQIVAAGIVVYTGLASEECVILTSQSTHWENHVLFNPLILRSCFEIVVWIFDTFDNNLDIKNGFTKYLKKSTQ